VDGTLALAAATRGMALDFFVLCGSNAAATGGFGQSDTAAAAAFLDAFAEAREAAGEVFTQTIGWGLFRWHPVTVDDPALAAQLRAGLAEYGIAAGEAAGVFARALASRLPRVVVSTQDLAAVTAQLDGFGAFPTVNAAAPAARPQAAGHAHPRPQQSVEYAAPAGPAEEAIAAVWQEAFGLDQVGRHDNFFELGGNSLLSIQIVTRLAAQSGLELSMASLLESPTVALLAERLPAAPAPTPPGAPAPDAGSPEDAAAAMERLLAEVEALGEEGAAARLVGELAESHAGAAPGGPAVEAGR